MENIVFVPIEKIIVNHYQPAEFIDQAQVLEIAESLKRFRDNGTKGLWQIPIARRVNGLYEEAFGRHRLLAFQHLAKEDPFWSEMPLVEKDLTDQEMFELMGVENLKRRDISVIEKARLFQDYMEKFGATSVQTGQAFGVTKETVRGTIRLLNLPKNLQSGVADGTITQNNARRLLTLQRVAPNHVQEVARELKGNKEADPDAVISRTLIGLDHTVEMWPNWRRGDEPMAGEHLWPLRLPAEKFPRSYLPEMTVTQAAKIVGGNWSSYHDKGVLQNRINHFLNSGQLEDMPGYSSEGETTSPNYERLAHLINPPACSACPFYTKVNGAHYCAFKDCYNRKVKAWKANVLAEAVQKFGIAEYDHKTDGKFVMLISYKPEHAKLVKSKSPDLRFKRGNSYGDFDGVSEGFMIVAVGKTAEKLLKEETRPATVQTNDESYHAEQRRLAKMREAHQTAAYDFLWNVGTPTFSTLLGAVANLPFIKEFSDRMVRGVPAEEPNGKSTKADRLDFYRRALLFSLLDDVLDMWDICQKKKPVTAMAKELRGIATTWGVKLPKNWLDLADQADQAITVTAETEAA